VATVVKYVTVGVDVGQQKDPTAIAVTIYPFPGAVHLRLATVKYLERLPLGTGYPEVKNRILDVLHNLEYAFYAEVPGRYMGEVRVDATGVGRPLVDMLHEAEPQARIYGVTLTAGHEQTRKGWDWYVPKQHLVNSLTRYMAERRLLLPDTQESRQFQRELRSFQGRKESANHVETGARQGTHDDLVIAVGLTLLQGRQTRRPPKQRQGVFGTVQRAASGADRTVINRKLQAELEEVEAIADPLEQAAARQGHFGVPLWRESTRAE
jgi:hypothetical protein